MNVATDAAAKGIKRNMKLFDRAAKRVAQRKIDADLPKEMHRMKRARYGVKANANTIKAARRMSESLIDILA